jgi:type II secretory pathway pseudopilin PulG
MNRRGFSLIEALVGVAILEIGIFGAVYLAQNISVLNRASNSDLAYMTTRNQILVSITDPRIWSYTLKGALNPNLACWLNQDKVPLATRNCANKTGNLVIYDIKGIEEFNFTEADAGLGPTGGKCTGFVAPPAAGNPLCPLGFQLKWTAACEAADPECVNPPIRVDATFIFNGIKTQKAPPPHRLNFSVYRYLRYCPVQAPGWTLEDAGVPTAVVVSGGDQVVSGNSGQVMTTGYAEMFLGGVAQIFAPCRTVSINFQDDMDNVPIAPMLAADPENQSQVCLFDEATNTCRFEVVRKVIGATRTIFLRNEGVDVFQVPASANITSASSLNLRVTRNLAEFLVDNKVYFTWRQKVTFPFHVRFRPASKSYSPAGFRAVNVNTLN